MVGLAIGDFDGDGKADIAYTGSSSPSISVYLGLGDGTFRGAVNFPAGSGPTGSLVAAEFNGDGKTDLAVTNSSNLQILLAGNGRFPGVATASLPDAMGGVPYSSTLAASGGVTPYVWSVSAGTTPAALSPSSNGTIAGTPPANISGGTYPFTVMVSDQNGVGFFSSQNLSISVSRGFQVLFQGYVGEVGGPYVDELYATGGTPPYKNWMVTAGSLPPGLSLDLASGVFTGTPTIAGTFSFTVTVSDSAGLTSLPANLGISVVPAPTLPTQSLPNALVGAAYSVALTGSGGFPPYQDWTISGGALPPALTLNTATGVIGGTPSAVGTFNFTVTMQDSAGKTSPAQSLSITVNQISCVYTISPGGQAFPGSGGTGTITIATAPGCPWTVIGLPPWVMLTTPGSGAGNASVSFQVLVNSGGDLSGSFTVAGSTFAIEQQAASIFGLNLIGSMPHIAAQENWITTFTLVNNTTSSNRARLSLFGSLQDGNNFAIFHRISDNQEAVVPLTPGTPNAPSYLLSFDNTGGIVTAAAVANVSPQAANIGYIIRDDTGAQIASGTLAVPGSGQISFDLPAANGSPATVGIRGTVEFDTPAGGQISVLGIRNTPQVTTTGTVTTLTTVPALANVGTGGGSLAFIASGGDGWQTTFVLVNAGTAAASAMLSFLDSNGNPLPLPISYPQIGVAVTTVSSITPTIAPGATLLVQSTGAVNLLTGSAQLATTGNVSGFVIFRHNGQEAVVPMDWSAEGLYHAKRFRVLEVQEGGVVYHPEAETKTVTFQRKTLDGRLIGSPREVLRATSFLKRDCFLRALIAWDEYTEGILPRTKMDELINCSSTYVIGIVHWLDKVRRSADELDHLG
jgi:hypothetical protein